MAEFLITILPRRTLFLDAIWTRNVSHGCRVRISHFNRFSVMGPPPATPTPSRFLVPKKSNNSTQQSHQRYQTPGVQRQDANFTQRQFFATSRFSSSSKPPASSDKVTWTAGAGFPTPALLKPKTPRNLRSTQDIIDSSPDSPEVLPPSSPTNYSQELPEPIELPSSLIPESPSKWSPGFEAGRSPKRRRISIASTESDSVSITNIRKEPDDIDLVPASSFPEEVIVKIEDENDDIYDKKDEQAEHRSYCSSEDDHEEYFRGHRRKGQSDLKDHTKPIFFDPPPFKPHDRTDTAHSPTFLPPDHLGDIFSPSKRRGAKYVSGGLAAELRDWLVDVKTESEKRSSSGALARLTVGSFRDGGPGMTLISGQPASKTAVDPSGSSSEGVRAILVGERGLVDDRTGGLDKKDRDNPIDGVSVGAVVGIAPPAWDIQLPGQGKWAVAYRWDVVGPVDDGNE